MNNNTSKIWEKHFGSTPCIGLDNPNFESFMDELTQDCLNEKRLIGLNDATGKEIREGDVIECDNYKMYGGKFTVVFDSILLQWVGHIPNVIPVPICHMKNPKIVSQ